MFSDLIKNIGQSVIQDAATSLSAVLVAHGLIAGSQVQGFIGSICFLGMLGLNAYLQHTQTKGK